MSGSCIITRFQNLGRKIEQRLANVLQGSQLIGSAGIWYLFIWFVTIWVWYLCLHLHQYLYFGSISYFMDPSSIPMWEVGIPYPLNWEQSNTREKWKKLIKEHMLQLHKDCPTFHKNHIWHGFQQFKSATRISELDRRHQSAFLKKRLCIHHVPPARAADKIIQPT